MNSEINEMELTDYNILQNIKAAFYRLWKLKLVVLFTTLLFFLSSVIYLTIVGDDFSYSSSATIYSAVYGSYSENATGVTVMNTYAEIINSSRVCDRAAAEINDIRISSAYLRSLISTGNVYLAGASTSSKSYGYKLVVYTRMDSPEFVVEITNAMAHAFASEINELLGVDVIQVFDEASVCFASTTYSDSLLMIIFSAVGFVISAGVIFVKEFFSSKVFLVSQCEKNRDLILGILPYNRQKVG